jgi:hypothetical protein
LGRFFWLLGVWVASFVSWVVVGGLPLGFWGFSLFLGFPLFLRAS